MRYERENEERREMREVGRERKHEKKKVKRKMMGQGAVGFYLRGLHHTSYILESDHTTL